MGKLSKTARASMPGQAKTTLYFVFRRGAPLGIGKRAVAVFQSQEAALAYVQAHEGLWLLRWA